MSTSFRCLLVTGMLVLAAGCASEETLIKPPGTAYESPGQPGYRQSPALNLDARPGQGAAVRVSDTLTFADALSLALLNNPRLQDYAWQVRVREAERLQAALPPNPELEAEMENFGGTGPFEGYDAREVTIRLAQKVLLGADRMKAKRLAAMSRKLAAWDYETQRLNVLTEVTKAYVSALEAQQQWHQQEELMQVAENLYNSVSAQVEAGKVSRLEQTKAGVELSRARIERENARDRFDAARSNLASYWGSDRPEFRTVSGTLSIPQTAPPSYADLGAFIERNPDVARWATEIGQREAALSLERAKGIPDMKISGGFRRVEDIDANAALIGFSIPLPFFDRNQGNIKAAKYNLIRVETQRNAAVTEAYRMLQETYKTLQATYFEVEQLRNKVLPGAETAFKAARIGYRQGKFNYLDVLDAQRTLFSSRTRYIQAIAQYNRTVAEIERLIGTPLSEISSN